MKNIPDEHEFESRIREIIRVDVLPKNNALTVLKNQKGSDILICRGGDKPSLFFIEVKYYNKGHGRLGFGHADGRGFQPEILRIRPAFFETNLRWVLGSLHSESYYLLTNEMVMQYISGGEISNKQNNIQTKVFSEANGLKSSELAVELLKWLSN